MKIYFSGSIRGGRDNQEYYEIVVKELSLYGEVLTEFIADKSLTSYGTLNMTDKEIYERDISFINNSDVLVAEVTTPSLGVGYEIAYAEKINKKIFCLYYQVDDKKTSSMISGNPNCKILSYRTKEELPEIIKSIFE